jgi:hypothetical protein
VPCSGEPLEPVVRQTLVVLEVHGVLRWQDFQPVRAGRIVLVQRQRDKIQGLRVLQPVGRPVCLPGRAGLSRNRLTLGTDSAFGSHSLTGDQNQQLMFRDRS